MRRLIFTAVAGCLMAVPAMAETIHVGVNGLICAFCAAGIEHNFGKNKDVTSVKVDLDAKLVTLTSDAPNAISDETIKEVITDSGFTVMSRHRQD